MRPWVALLFAVSLLNSCEAQGSSAVTTVFVKKGDDLILDVDADVPESFLFVEWKFNKTVDVVRFAPGGDRLVLPDFTGRIEFPVKKFSVKLKNLQEADSGVYAARVVTFQEGEKPLSEYKVRVQDPDPAVPVHVIVIPIIAILCTIVVVSGLFRYRRKRANHERESIENTVYEIPQVTATAQPQDQSPPDDDSGLSPTSTYSLVGPHTGSLRPTEAGGTALPESLYAQVEKPARSSNN